jgi:hypothetical protein
MHGPKPKTWGLLGKSEKRRRAAKEVQKAAAM